MDYGVSQGPQYRVTTPSATNQWPSEGAEQDMKQSSEEPADSTSPEANGVYSGQEQQHQQQWPWADDEPQAERDSDYDEEPEPPPGVLQRSDSGSGYDTDLSLPSHGRWVTTADSRTVFSLLDADERGRPRTQVHHAAMQDMQPASQDSVPTRCPPSQRRPALAPRATITCCLGLQHWLLLLSPVIGYPPGRPS